MRSENPHVIIIHLAAHPCQRPCAISIIAKMIADELGRELAIVKTNWDGLIPALTSGTVDLIIAGMSHI